jgi:hypothetical protein
MELPLLDRVAGSGLLVASFADVFQVVLGVVLSLCGLGLLLLGLIAVADREWKRGGAATLVGAGLLAAGMWLVGVWP